MKKMKKLASLFLASVMALSMTATAFADPTDPGDGGSTGASTGYSITVQKPTNSSISIKDKEYKAYKLFDVTYDLEKNDGGAYAYTVADDFKDFTYEVGEASYKGDALIGYLGTLTNNAKALDAFAAAAFKYIDEKGITASGTATADENGATIELEEAGYYLISGTATSSEEDRGSETITAACALDTTNPTATVTVKADAPSIDKFIQEADSANGQDGKGTAQDVGSVVKFKLTSKVPNMTGYTKYTYTVHDTLSSGLTFDADSVKVTIDTKDYTDFTVKTEDVEGSFDIIFDPDVFINQTEGADIVITYSATINENALKTQVETNTVNLEYSSNPYDESEHEKTPDKEVYVYDFDIVINKYAENKDDPDDKTGYLAGAQFVLYKEADGKILAYNQGKDDDNRWVEMTITGDKTPAAIETALSAAAEAGQITKVETNANGAASFEGLEEGTYQLVEIVAPNGYNKLKDPVTVTIVAEYNDDGTLKLKTTTDDSTQTTVTAAGSATKYLQVVDVPNNTGVELPSTGGIGTTIFYAAGIILMAGAVFFVIRRRRA